MANKTERELSAEDVLEADANGAASISQRSAIVVGTSEIS